MPIEPPSIQIGDCLELLKAIPSKSVNLVLCDLPYGATDNAWDTQIPLKPLFKQYRRILAPKGAVILTAQGRFSAQLIVASGTLYRYSLVWKKDRITGFLNAHKMPLREHEDILVMYRELPTYNPIKTPSNRPNQGTQLPGKRSSSYRATGTAKAWTDDGYRFPTSVIEIPAVPCSKALHPTEKPIALGEYLIQTYSNPGDLVLDNACGSGAFLKAAQNLGRRAIGMELDPEIAQTAKTRLGL